MSWQAIGSSVTGTSHQRAGLPCQDDHDYCFLNDRTIIIGAVADGAGSASKSDKGAELTTDAMLRLLALEEAQNVLLGDFSTQERKALVEKVCQILIQAVRERLKEYADELQCPVTDFACTLIAFIADDKRVVAMQIGDGFIVVRSSTSDEYRLIFKPDKGEFSNETTFVTSDSAIAETKVEVLPVQHTFICAATDGLESVALHYQGWEPHKDFFKPLETFVSTCDTAHEAELVSGLEVFLSSERLAKKTGDDKTLLLCIAQQSTPFEEVDVDAVNCEMTQDEYVL